MLRQTVARGQAFQEGKIQKEWLLRLAFSSFSPKTIWM
jgi:hypothetical protein